MAAPWGVQTQVFVQGGLKRAKKTCSHMSYFLLSFEWDPFSPENSIRTKPCAGSLLEQAQKKDVSHFTGRKAQKSIEKRVFIFSSPLSLLSMENHNQQFSGRA